MGQSESEFRRTKKLHECHVRNHRPQVGNRMKRKALKQGAEGRPSPARVGRWRRSRVEWREFGGKLLRGVVLFMSRTREFK